MINEWPHKSPYAEATARLLTAINEAAIRDAEYRFTESMDAFARVRIANDHATNIRDDLAALIDESQRS